MNRLRPLIAPGLASLLALAILVGLGVWQLHRLAWKEALVAEVASRAVAPAAPLPAEVDWSALKPDDYEYRHVRVSGVYDRAHQALVFRAIEQPRGRYGGHGYLVMTPLRLADGASVIVNRGFTPMDRKGEATAALAGDVEVSGLMRAPEPRNLFTPADNPSAGEWYTRDPRAIAAALGVERAAPFTIDADAGDPGALPQGGETILIFPNNHFQYALTWFGLAVALVGVFAAYALGVLRKPAPVGAS